MKIALSTASLYLYPLRYTFRLARELGFDGLELSMGPEVRWRGGHYVRRLSQEYGLNLFGLHPPMFSSSGEIKLEGFLPKMVSLGREIGSPMLVVHAPMVVGSDEGSRDIEALLRARQELGGLLLTLETRARFVGEEKRLFDDLKVLCDFAVKNGLYLTLDTAHVGTLGYDLLEAYEICKPRLVNIHLSDLRQEKPPGKWSYLQTFFQHHQMPGEGYLPLEDLLDRLVGDGYGGTVVVEVSPFALGAWWPGMVKRNLRKCLAFIHGVGGKGGHMGSTLPLSY